MKLLAVKEASKFTKELERWHKLNPKITLRIRKLVEEICLNPLSPRIGSPEILDGRGKLRSLRISQKHRLIYCINDDSILFVSCVGHYGDH
jgi:toxin YoeB